MSRYTDDILRKSYLSFRDFYSSKKAMKIETALPIRLPNFPEDISENIVRLIIRNYEGYNDVLWSKEVNKPGDLISETLGIIEVKCSSSSGPCSFGPVKEFNVWFFLDVRNFEDDIFICHKVDLSSQSSQWKNLKVNNLQTLEMQSKQKRRPRANWDTIIYPQLKEYCHKVYEGSFEGIFLNEPTIMMNFNEDNDVFE
jgi:hypothetical protein